MRTHELSALHPRYGYRRIVALLRQEGWATSRKQVHRLRRAERTTAEGLRVPPPRRRQSRRGVSTGLPTQATHRGHVWTWDFVADAIEARSPDGQQVTLAGILAVETQRDFLVDIDVERHARRADRQTHFVEPTLFAGLVENDVGCALAVL